MNEEKTIIEVNGIKLEVDLRTAKRIDQFKVGDKVKVLVKSYSSYQSYPGIIAGLDNFKERPTIIVAYIDLQYSSCSLKFTYINKDSADVEICPANDVDLSVDKSDVLNKFDEEIRKKSLEIVEIENRKKYFIENFQRHFEL